jgi:hypothetical protein
MANLRKPGICFFILSRECPDGEFVEEETVRDRRLEKHPGAVGFPRRADLEPVEIAIVR